MEFTTEEDALRTTCQKQPDEWPRMEFTEGALKHTLPPGKRTKPKRKATIHNQLTITKAQGTTCTILRRPQEPLKPGQC
jgi:hypothetical protein